MNTISRNPWRLKLRAVDSRTDSNVRSSTLMVPGKRMCAAGGSQLWREKWLRSQQDIVVGAHAIDECDRHAATRVTELCGLVVLGLRQEWKRLPHVAPVIGIQLLLLRQDACVLEMRDADVERREREPGTVRLRDSLRHLRFQHLEIARGGEDRRFRVEPIPAAPITPRLLGQLH